MFGSDQGLVGQFNDVVADHAVKTLAALPAKPEVWAVGERVHARLADAGLPLAGLFTVPNSVKAITPLVGQILVESEARRSRGEIDELHLFYNRPTSGAVYESVNQRLLPLDEIWRRELAELPWPTKNLPEVLGSGAATLRALIREYLFVSLFRACAESLASENASRLAAMQRADKNIDELLEDLNGTFHRLRQSGIDEELFDVISGFEALNVEEKHEKQSLETMGNARPIHLAGLHPTRSDRQWQAPASVRRRWTAGDDLMKVVITLSPRDYDAVLFDLDGVVTRTATVHASAWKKLFDGFLEQRATQAGEPFVPFDIDTDYLRYVDGKPRYDGVAAFLESRGIAALGIPNSNSPRTAT